MAMDFNQIITIVFIITKLTRFSIANDTQESTQQSKDCSRQKYCRRGTHVVCQYYDPDQIFGHRCKKPLRIEVTPNMQHHILANVNFLRGKIAMGRETGKDGEDLPRAYGLVKLEWDRELAFSAQVLANQCLGEREDKCRATERFPNPGQTIAIIQYKYPNWEYLQSSDSERGLDEMKLIFAMDIFLRSSHTSKINVTKDIFTNYPPVDELVDINLKHYLNLIYGGVTHIGCGVSAYTNKINGDIKAIKNIVQIVCNFSDAPKRNQPVYNIVPPIPGQGYTERCGCPRGYKETRSCLCERDAKNVRRGLQLKNDLETDLKQESKKSIKNQTTHNEEIVASEKKVREPNDQPMRHVISNSRNIIVFRRNPEEYLPDEEIVEITESTTLTEITNATMISNLTRQWVERSKGHSSSNSHSSYSRPSYHGGSFGSHSGYGGGYRGSYGGGYRGSYGSGYRGNHRYKNPRSGWGGAGSYHDELGRLIKIPRVSFLTRIVNGFKNLFRKMGCG